MSADTRTLAFYDAEAAVYAGKAHSGDRLDDFIAALRAGAHVLDLGCGGGAHSAVLRAAGFAVTSIDGSSGLAAEARQRWNVDVRVMRFDELDFVDAFEGVWASASLHHARADDLPRIFAAIHRATKAGGAFHATLKVGEDRRDKLGRFYCAMNEATLASLAADWRDVQIESNQGVGYDGETTPWLKLRAIR